MSEEKKTMYVVKYSTGSYDGYEEIDVFATDKKATATKYVTKFNKILKKWEAHYKQYEEDTGGMAWIKEEYVQKHYNRWRRLRETNTCFWTEIEIR